MYIKETDKQEQNKNDEKQKKKNVTKTRGYVIKIYIKPMKQQVIFKGK